MKKTLFLLLLLPLLGRGLGGGCLFAQNTIDVSELKVEAGTVTFNVKWPDAGASNLWSDTVWVFVDYNKNGKMTRLPLLLEAGATLTATSSPGVGKLVEENVKGAWVVGDARTNGSFSATVQLLTATADLYGACAYASSYPPVGQYVSSSEIIFSGTPMYEIWLTSADGLEMIESGGTFLLPCSYTVSSFTDATGAPGIFNCIRPVLYTLSGADVCVGDEVALTLAGSQSGWQYRLYDGTMPVGSAVPGTDGSLIFTDASATAGGHTYTVQTVDGAGVRCDMPASNTLDITVNPTPIISLSSGDASQSVNQGTGITTIVYTATDATGISSSSSFPDGVGGIYSSGSYTISGTPTVNGIFNYTVTTANGNGCADATASGTITVTQPQGSCTYTEPAVVGTFADFHTTSAYTATTYTSLMDERDGKNYPVVKISSGTYTRWIMARNLNYQGIASNPSSTLTFNSASDYANGSLFNASTAGAGTFAIGSFWCPGKNNTTSSDRANCDVWGALYTWETPMMVDGRWNSDTRNDKAWGSDPSYGTNTSSANTNTGGRGANGHGICPEHWHVPTDGEWGDLFNAMETGAATVAHNASTGWLGSVAGSYSKSACNCSSATYCDTDNGTNAVTSWYGGTSSKPGSDLYGFRVLPSGLRGSSGSYFSSRGSNAFFWSSSAIDGTHAWYRYFDYSHATVSRNAYYRSFGMSVRCIKD
jgi:uncharacterized protein (TIGR02145 family)